MQNNKNNLLKNPKIQTKSTKEPDAQKGRRIRRLPRRRRVSGDDIFLLYKINNIIIERNLLQPDQRILIAVSGGQDSICLLRILFNLKKKWNWKLGIIHCDHRWNPQGSKCQAEHVAYLAVNLQINYHEGIAIESVQKEGSARIWRYNLIQIVAISNNYTAVITGHNASDRIETLLYNLTRGSGLHGLQSIKWKRYLCFFRFTQSVVYHRKSSFFFKNLKYRKTFADAKAVDPVGSPGRNRFYGRLGRKQLHLIRPLLETTRTEIRNVMNVWNFPSWPDVSNKELRIRRNRIRHRLIPYIRIHYNPNIDQTLVRWAEIVQSETLYLEQLTNYILLKIEIKKKFSYISSPNGPYLLRGPPQGDQRVDPCGEDLDFYQSAIPIDLLRSLPLAIQRRVLKQYIYRNTNSILGFQYVEQIRLSCLFSLRDSFRAAPSSPLCSAPIVASRVVSPEGASCGGPLRPSGDGATQGLPPPEGWTPGGGLAWRRASGSGSGRGQPEATTKGSHPPRGGFRGVDSPPGESPAMAPAGGSRTSVLRRSALAPLVAPPAKGSGDKGPRGKLSEPPRETPATKEAATMGAGGLRNRHRPTNLSNHISIRSTNSSLSGNNNADGPRLTTSHRRNGRWKGPEGKNNKLIVNNPWLIFPGGIKLLVRKNYIFIFSPRLAASLQPK